MNRTLKPHSALPAGRGVLDWLPAMLPLMVLAVAASSCVFAAAVEPYGDLESLDSKSASKRLVDLVEPEYPSIAKINYIQGRVKLEIVVNQRGYVAEAHILKGQPLLAASAIEAVRKWRYQPLIQAGVAVPFRTIVKINFRIHPRHLSKIPPDARRFLDKQVRPPEVVAEPGGNVASKFVLLRVLVGAKGQVLDSMPLGKVTDALQSARRQILCWKFRAARWGALAVPWYMIIRVPLGRALCAEAEGNSNARQAN